MDLLPLPSLLSLASTCSRLYQLLANPSLWRNLHLHPSMVTNPWESFNGMLKDKGKHVRKITFRCSGLLPEVLDGKDRLMLEYAVEVCGSNLASLTVSNLRIRDLEIIAKNCQVLNSLSIGDLILEDSNQDWVWLGASAYKFQHLEHFSANFRLVDDDAQDLCNRCRLIKANVASRRLLHGLIKSNSSLKKMVLGLGGMRRLGKSLQRYFVSLLNFLNKLSGFVDSWSCVI